MLELSGSTEFLPHPPETPVEATNHPVNLGEVALNCAELPSGTFGREPATVNGLTLRLDPQFRQVLG